MKKEILEIVERAYNASQKAHQEHKDEVKRIEANYKGEARLNALTETNNAYYETLRSNEEKALNEVNTILDQAAERVKTIITNTPDESFYRDIQIIKELNSMGLLSDEKKKAYLEKYKTCFEATLYLTALLIAAINRVANSIH